MTNIGLLLNEAASLMKREFERAARPYKLTLMQWRVLGQLMRAGDMRQNELCAAINASPMTVSDVAERLEAAGLILREVDPEDSRAKRLALTDEGNALVGQMRVVATGVFDKALAGIDPQDIEVLTRSLTQITENLEDR